MKKKIIASVKINFKFFERNHFLWIIYGFFTLHCFLFLLISLLSPFTKESPFYTMQSIFNGFSTYLTLIIALLGLLMIYNYLTTRYLKLIFTKPFTTEEFLLSLYLSISIFGFLAFLFVFFLMGIMFIVYKIPFQIGLIYIIIQNFYNAMQYALILLFLGIFFHPLLAIFIYLFFNEKIFYLLLLTAKDLIETSKGLKLFSAKVLYAISYFFYNLFPMDTPYHEEYYNVVTSWIVPEKGWLHLLISSFYFAIFSSLIYFLSTFALKKKQLY